MTNGFLTKRLVSSTDIPPDSHRVAVRLAVGAGIP
jgi:hypothetical protein